MNRGIFISIEGPDGSGKSTQLKNIEKFFNERNLEVIFTREPGGTLIGEKIREILLDKANIGMDSMTEAMLYAAARAQHVSQVIKPALEQGKVVVCDRFVDSSIAYQGFGRGLGDCVADINSYAIRDFMPDVTFLMRLDPRIGKNRIGNREQDRLELEKEAFHTSVFEGYLEIEKKNPKRVFGIDASRSIEEIKYDIYRKLEEVLESVSK